MRADDWVKIGKVRKPTGTEGFVRMDIEPNFVQTIIESNHVFIKVAGDYVPYFIEEIYEYGDGLNCKFEELDFPEDALKLNLCEIYLPEESIQSVQYTATKEKLSLIDYKIFNVETKELIGIILSVDVYPQQLIANVSTQSGIKLIPLNDNFITDINNSQKHLFILIPDGLLSI